MSKKQKRRQTPPKKNSGSKDRQLQKVILATAILNLLRALIDLLNKLIDWATE